MTRRLRLLAILVFAAVMGSSAVALACTCIQPGPACQAFWTTDAVFDATVTSITRIERTEIRPAFGPGAGHFSRNLL